MKIELKRIKLSDLYAGYKDNDIKGVVGYGGKLDIRPPYQREFVYKDKQKIAVVETIKKGFPLNVMYWVVNKTINADDSTTEAYEVLDGQQRTISICQYMAGDFSVDELYYHSLTQAQKNDFDNYELMVYFCEGRDDEKLDWFKTINIAGEQLTAQELRNAIYTGTWLVNAKEYFSRRNCVAEQRGKRYLDGNVIQQKYLETALDWISPGKIEDYMSKHQHDADADELRQHFSKIIDWVDRTFTTYRQDMRGIDWGYLYREYGAEKFNSNDLEKEISALMIDDEVTNKKGIYEYLLSNKKKKNKLSLRAFTEKDRNEAFERQKAPGSSKATCPDCADPTKLYDLSEMQADHIVPWSKGGKTIASNCQMLCAHHNGVKSNK